MPQLKAADPSHTLPGEGPTGHDDWAGHGFALFRNEGRGLAGRGRAQLASPSGVESRGAGGKARGLERPR